MCVHENIFTLYFTVYLFKLAEIQRELMLMIRTMMVRIKSRGVTTLLYYGIRRAQLEEYRQRQGGCRFHQRCWNAISIPRRKSDRGRIADATPESQKDCSDEYREAFGASRRARPLPAWSSRGQRGLFKVNGHAADHFIHSAYHDRQLDQ